MILPSSASLFLQQPSPTHPTPFSAAHHLTLPAYISLFAASKPLPACSQQTDDILLYHKQSIPDYPFPLRPGLPASEQRHSRMGRLISRTNPRISLLSLLLLSGLSLAHHFHLLAEASAASKTSLHTFSATNGNPPQTYNASSFVSACGGNGASTCKNNKSATTTARKGLMYQVFQSLNRLARRARPRRIITVDQTGNGDSQTIQGAVDLVPENNRLRVIIKIAAGVYREKITVPYTKPFITFQGSGNGVTVIAWNARASDKGGGGQNLGTFDSASVAVEADYFVAKDITFQNTAPPPLPGSQGMQAVALRISGDKAAFIDCLMLGSQDTLFDHLGRHLFLRCYIEGAIDFIFGDGRSLYLDCELHANAVTYGAIAASQRTSPEQNTGFAFVRCKVTGSGWLYLGRAWGRYARVVFAFSYFDKIIVPEGWSDWGDPSRRETVFFGEYRCSGPGAIGISEGSWGRQLRFEEARPFLGIGFINGHKWLHDLN